MFKNLFGSKKESTEIKITEEQCFFSNLGLGTLVDNFLKVWDNLVSCYRHDESFFTQCTYEKVYLSFVLPDVCVKGHKNSAIFSLEKC